MRVPSGRTGARLPPKAGTASGRYATGTVTALSSEPQRAQMGGWRSSRWSSGAGPVWQNGCDITASSRNGVRPLPPGSRYRSARRCPPPHGWDAPGASWRSSRMLWCRAMAGCGYGVAERVRNRSRKPERRPAATPRGRLPLCLTAPVFAMVGRALRSAFRLQLREALCQAVLAGGYGSAERVRGCSRRPERRPAATTR